MSRRRRRQQIGLLPAVRCAECGLLPCRGRRVLAARALLGRAGEHWQASGVAAAHLQDKRPHGSASGCPSAPRQHRAGSGSLRSQRKPGGAVGGWPDCCGLGWLTRPQSPSNSDACKPLGCQSALHGLPHGRGPAGKPRSPQQAGVRHHRSCLHRHPGPGSLPAKGRPCDANPWQRRLPLL